MKFNQTRTAAHRATWDKCPGVMRDQAADYLRLAAMTQIPALAEVFRAKARALYAQAALAERAVGQPVHFE
ncbi:MAG: hypothetical protein JOY66_09000 [Acetobacteraceae bacterium]|nr:hypothetical protein [Acetobacteraceae bacterium]